MRGPHLGLMRGAGRRGLRRRLLPRRGRLSLTCGGGLDLSRAGGLGLDARLVLRSQRLRAFGGVGLSFGVCGGDLGRLSLLPSRLDLGSPRGRLSLGVLNRRVLPLTGV